MKQGLLLFVKSWTAKNSLRLRRRQGGGAGDTAERRELLRFKRRNPEVSSWAIVKLKEAVKAPVSPLLSVDPGMTSETTRG